MSVRFFNTPALHLTIGKSRLRSAMHGLLCLITVYALNMIAYRGYPATTLLMLVPAAALLWRQYGGGAQGSSLSWRQGVWTLCLCRDDRVDQPFIIEPTPNTVALPWCIYLAYRPVQQKRAAGLWLFRDSLDRDAWRQLRVRVRLQDYRLDDPLVRN